MTIKYSKNQLQNIKNTISELFYCEGDGLFWAVDRTTWLKKGRLAGSITGKGYRVVQFDEMTMSVHRVVFLMHHGYLPETIDHKDGNKQNNNINNLRECTLAENGHNRKLNKNSTSKVKGVSWHKASNQWRARVQTNLTRIELGGFDDINDADQAIRDYRSKSHKEFTRHE